MRIPGQPSEAIAWTRQFKQGRLFTRRSGRARHIQRTRLPPPVINALFWTAKRDVEAVKK